MANIFDYIKWRGDLDFNTLPFNPVDNIIFSQLSYLTLDGIVPGVEDKDGISIDLAVRIFDEKIKSPQGLVLTSFFKEDPDLIRALAFSKRYGNCQLFGYVNKIDEDRELQFSALSIYTSDNHCFVVFRGTDTSIIGWKEDFNMCFKEVIPAQIEAVNYLEKMAPMIRLPLRIGGHSKGGNLAIYAASQCSKNIRQNITDIYSNDAPGFHEKIITSPGFISVENRIHSYVPQSSIIGMFLEHRNDYTVIKSSENGLLQHSLYSWEVTHNDLVRAEKSTLSSQFINITLREWVDSLDKPRREQFIETLYHILSAAEVKSIIELEKSWFTSVGKVFKSLNTVEESKRKLVRQTLKELFNTAQKNFEKYIKYKKEHPELSSG